MVLAEHCYKCNSAAAEASGKLKAGLKLALEACDPGAHEVADEAVRSLN